MCLHERDTLNFLCLTLEQCLLLVLLCTVRAQGTTFVDLLYIAIVTFSVSSSDFVEPTSTFDNRITFFSLIFKSPDRNSEDNGHIHVAT